MDSERRPEPESPEEARRQALIYLAEGFQYVRQIPGGRHYYHVRNYFITVSICGEREFGHRAIDVLNDPPAFPENKEAFRKIIDNPQDFLEKGALTNLERASDPIAGSRAYASLARFVHPATGEVVPFEPYMRDLIDAEKYQGLTAEEIIDGLAPELIPMAEMVTIKERLANALDTFETAPEVDMDTASLSPADLRKDDERENWTFPELRQVSREIAPHFQINPELPLTIKLPNDDPVLLAKRGNLALYVHRGNDHQERGLFIARE